MIKFLFDCDTWWWQTFICLQRPFQKCCNQYIRTTLSFFFTKYSLICSSFNQQSTRLHILLLFGNVVQVQYYLLWFDLEKRYYDTPTNKYPTQLVLLQAGDIFRIPILKFNTTFCDVITCEIPLSACSTNRQPQHDNLANRNFVASIVRPALLARYEFMLNSCPQVVGKNLSDCPSLTLRFALLTQYQKSYDTKHSLYLETKLMQCYGNYICNIAFIVKICW